MRNYLFISTLTLISGLAFGAEKFPGIQNIMTHEEFIKAGLDKQSPAELEALNQWLIRYTANEAPIIRQAVDEVKEEAEKDIRSVIVGEFTGWSGDTKFRLANGQIWQQRIRGKWKTSLSNPEVFITRNFLGFYKMEVVSTKKKIGVKRLK